MKKNRKYNYVFPVLLGMWFVREGGHFGADHEQKACLKTELSFKLSFYLSKPMDSDPMHTP